MDQYVLSHLVADEDSTTAAEAPLISGALLSVVLGLLDQYVLSQSARVTSVEAVSGALLLVVLGLLAENLFPLLVERACVSAAEAVGQAGENLFPLLMAERAGKVKKVAMGLLG